MVEMERDLAALRFLEGSVLRPGEAVAWKGRPDPRVAATAPSVVMPAVFGLPLLLFMGQVTLGALATSPVVAFFGLPFAAGGAFLIARPLLFLRRARRSYYAITDRRVVVITAGRRFEAASRPGIVEVIWRRRPFATRGTIRLGRDEALAADGFPLTRFDDALWGIEDLDGAKRAFEALNARRTLGKARG